MQHEPNLAAMLAHYAEAVGAEMKQALDAYDAPRDYYDMMRYHLGWVNERFEPVDGARGKGLRAGLLLLIHELLGGVQADALPLAAAVELLHNFSLVHDDIEDGRMTRRHRATVWSIWGAGLGINLGDGPFEVAHLARYHAPLNAHGRPEPRQRLRALYAQADDATAEILALLAESDARERAQSYLQEHRAAAMVALQQMQLTPAAGDLLRQVAALFIDRTA